MSWLLLTFIAVFSRATFSIATKLLTNTLQVSPGTQSLLVMGVATFWTVLLSPFLGGISFAHMGHLWPTVVMMILTTSIGNILFFKGQQLLDAGTTQIAFSSVLVWGTILSIIVLGSRFSLVQMFGILLLLATIILVQYRKSVKRLDIGVALIVAAAALFAAFQVASAQLASHMTAATYLVLAYGGAALCIGTVYAKRIQADVRTLRGRLPDVLKTTTFAGSTMLLFYLFSYLAYQKAPDRGVVVLLMTTQVILSVILGIIFLKERAGMTRKLIAAALALVASMLIKA